MMVSHQIYYLLLLVLVMAVFRACTLNVKGMQDNAKRAEVLHYLRQQNCDILFLQETHVASKADISAWENEWKGRTFWSCGSSNGRGVAILFHPSLDFSLINVRQDTEGRILTMQIHLDNTPIQLVNVYAPNDSAERVQFFENLWNHSCAGLPTIIGGDFNCVADLHLDKWGGNPQLLKPGAQALHSFTNNFNNVDVYRHLNKQGREVTWTDKRGTVASRLDRFYLPAAFLSERSKCDILPCYFSDHSLVKICFQLPEASPKGQGIWKLNVSVLQDNEFELQIRQFWSEWRDNKVNFPDQRLWWDIGKFQMKRIAIRYSVGLTKARASRKTELELEFQRVNNNRPVDGVRLQEIKSELAELQSKRAEGTKIRSKAKWLEEGERPTKYFFNLENHKQNKKCIRELSSPNGETIKSNPEILAQLGRFYKSLYSAEATNKTSQDLLLNKLTNKLSPEERELLEHKLSHPECREALDAMEAGKSPGNDGFPAEFYRRFWGLLGSDLVDTLNYGHDRGQLSPSQRQSVLSLLFKKGDRLLLKNWRPISLLNVDYKIGSKALANRLKKVLDSVLHVDQTCGVPGRSIFENLFLVRDIIEYADAKQVPGVVIGLDQEKAFDRIDREYLNRVLEQFNFGPVFRRWISTLYSGTQSAVLNNGWLTNYFEVQRGVRQGCPLSPLLYCLGAEALGQAIRTDSQIEGLSCPIPRFVSKVSQYADDMTLTLGNSYSVKRAFALVRLYESASGSKLNAEKSEGLWIGSARDSPERPVDIRWQQSQLKILGVWFGYGNVAASNWLSRVEKFQKKLDMWRGRALSLKGKALIINALGASGLWYTATVLPMPANVAQKISRLIWEFFWSGKTELVTRKQCVQPREKGGMGVVHVPSKLKALQLRWVAVALDSDSSVKWVHFARYWLGRQLAKRPEWLWLNSNSLPHADPSLRPPAYSNIWTYLGEVKQWVLAAPIVDFTVRKVYSQFVTTLTFEAKTARKWLYLAGDNLPWPYIWQNAYGGLSTNWEGDLAWKFLHRVVKTSAFLTKWRNLGISKACHRCRRTEDIEHVFMDCPYAQYVWDWALEIISFVNGSNIKYDIHTILLRASLTHSRQSKQQTNLVAYLIKLVLWCLWDARNKSRFQQRDVTPQQIIAHIKSTIISRIQGAFLLPTATPKSVHALWGVNNVLCIFHKGEFFLSPNLG